MILDINALLSNAQAITVTAPSTGTYDTAGLGVGVAVSNSFGTASVFGSDVGGGGPLASAPQLLIAVTAAFTAAGAATLQPQLQAAIDNGSAQPGTWNTIAEQDPYPKASLTKGAALDPFTVPRRYLGQAFPRFYRINYVVATGPMTAGAVIAGLLTGLDDQPAYPANF